MNFSVNHTVISSDKILRPTQVEIDLKTLSENFQKIKTFVTPTKIMPVIKANAYGHGLVRIARTFQKLKVDYLGVAFVEEGILLRKKGITLPILILGGTWGNQASLFLKYNLTITVFSSEKLIQIDSVAEQMKTKAKVHVKIDTGMGRLGIPYHYAEKFLEQLYKFKNIEIEGIFSHFANSDKYDLTDARIQLERFQQVLQFFEKHSVKMPLRHISNSGAILQLPEANYDMVRPGIIIYGIYPSREVQKSIQVKPTLTWKSIVIYYKSLARDQSVGYGSTWRSDHNVGVVTIPVGYGDGYLRNMSNRAKVLLKGKKYPVVGTISMDQIVVNIEDNISESGDEITLIGNNGNTSITCEDFADWAGTIPYEILTNINTRVPRIYRS